MAKTMEPNVNVNEVSKVSAGTVIKGEISTPNDIRIDGTFEGKIFSKGRVTVGEKAVVKGDIIGQNVDFLGTIKGDFYVKDTLSLKAGSSVQGDLFFQRLQVELDAKFTGKCQVIGEAEFNKVSEPMRSLLK